MKKIDNVLFPSFMLLLRAFLSDSYTKEFFFGGLETFYYRCLSAEKNLGYGKKFGAWEKPW